MVLAVPGYTEDQLSLSIDDNVLEIRAQGAASTDNEVYLRREIRQLPFRYRVELPERAQVDQISAELKAGLLTVRIPLQGKKVIPVKIHSVDTTKSLQA